MLPPSAGSKHVTRFVLMCMWFLETRGGGGRSGVGALPGPIGKEDQETCSYGPYKGCGKQHPQEKHWHLISPSDGSPSQIFTRHIVP
jgi:hypothetical protein